MYDISHHAELSSTISLITSKQQQQNLSSKTRDLTLVSSFWEYYSGFLSVSVVKTNLEKEQLYSDYTFRLVQL